MVKTREEVTEKIQLVIVKKLRVALERVTPQADFINDLGADSLDGVEIIMAIEDEFEEDGLGEISEEEEGKIKNLKDATDYVMNIIGQ